MSHEVPPQRPIPYAQRRAEEIMTDAERMAIEEGRSIAEASGRHPRQASAVSADAKYIVRWLVWIFVVLPAVAALIYFLSR
jgi:hypothetical protein